MLSYPATHQGRQYQQNLFVRPWLLARLPDLDAVYARQPRYSSRSLPGVSSRTLRRARVLALGEQNKRFFLTSLWIGHHQRVRAVHGVACEKRTYVVITARRPVRRRRAYIHPLRLLFNRDVLFNALQNVPLQVYVLITI